ncbi:unnamed protein product [Moneuplotes crassus]|uniref:Uncharacterized protein n=1 Tax=Euplotes crassus TaxID=5936 RepID=A0AAD1Y9W6_EUPCR|nr:unnamed protein product [Moneuplotes crassus]
MVLLPPSNDILIESGQVQLQKPDISLVNNTTNSNQDISDEDRIRTEFQSISYAKQDPFPKEKSNKSTLNHSDSHSLFKEDTQSVWETIRNEVIPKWNQYMITKNRRKEADPSVRSRLDTFRKKILRDLREFFRILFRRRFHLSKYRTAEGVTKCVRTFFQELDFTLSDEDLADHQLFKFIHQTHRYTSDRVAINSRQQKASPFTCVDKYNNTKFKIFIRHPLCAQMIKFVFTNFMEHYAPFVKSNMRKKVMSVIKEVLQSFSD